MNAIVAVDKEWSIGKDNNLLFSLPLDLKDNFRKMTLNKVVVMGANTFKSLPNGALPKRINIVLDSKGTQYDNAVTVTSLDELLQYVSQYSTDDVFVCGGGVVYKLLLPYCHKAYVTKVDAVGNGTVFFPNLDDNKDWQCVSTLPTVIDNGYNTAVSVYVNNALTKQ